MTQRMIDTTGNEAESTTLSKIQDNFTDLYGGTLSAYATAAQGAKADTALQPVVANAKIAGGGWAKHALVAGGAAGDITVTGIKVGDELLEVLWFVGAGTAVTDVTDLTAEFTITATNTINNTGGTASTGDKLLVRYNKLTA
jgi:hypothetical protein